MKFPDPERTGPDGIVAVGGPLNPESLEAAYTSGIFPWPQKDLPLLWFSPPQRGVLYFDSFKIPKSTQKAIKKQLFQITRDQAFKEVIENCARVKRSHEHGTWIIPEMIQAYCTLHEAGQALSVEAWQDGQLVGGLYGVLFRGVFSGESMFIKKTEASKVCLASLVDFLRGEGHRWIDIQMVTPLLKSFGGEYILRRRFLEQLKERQQQSL